MCFVSLWCSAFELLDTKKDAVSFEIRLEVREKLCASIDLRVEVCVLLSRTPSKAPTPCRQPPAEQDLVVGPLVGGVRLTLPPG